MTDYWNWAVEFTEKNTYKECMEYVRTLDYMYNLTQQKNFDLGLRRAQLFCATQAKYQAKEIQSNL